jgi:hypothetical protein
MTKEVQMGILYQRLVCTLAGRSWRLVIFAGLVIVLLLAPGLFCPAGIELPRVIDIANGDQDITIFGIDSGDLLGKFNSIATGDFNGDGWQDLLLGAPLGDGPNNSRPEAGEAYVIFGGPGLPSSIDLADFPGPSIRIYGKDPGDNLGCAVASGDINGDGIDDIIISSCEGDGPNNDRFGLGEIYIILGAISFPSVIDLFDLGSYNVIIYGVNTQERFGAALGTADVNGDKIDDLVIGAPDADGWRATRPDAGDVFIVFGSYQPPSVIDLRTTEYPHVSIYGANAGDHLGEAVATTDVNGDGISDILIGAPGGDGSGDSRPDAGDAYLIYGRAAWPEMIDLGAAAADVSLFGEDAGDRFGSSVLISDIDGDGFEDLVIGAPLARGPENLRGGAGEVYIIRGAEGFSPTIDLAKSPPDSIIFGREPLDNLGVSLASGDVNKDGISDLLIGASGADGPDKRADAGAAYLVWGGGLPAQLDLARESADVTIYGASPLDKLGSALWSSDIDGDGTDDILVGAVGADGPKDRIPDAGEIYVIYGIPKPQHPPVADAGPDQVVIKDTVVQLDGSGSFDPDGDRLRYTWSFIAKPEGSIAVLSDPNVIKPTFVADALGRYIVQLQVDDGRGGRDTDQVEIIATLGRKGDVDLDGDVDIVDAQWAAEYIVSLRELNEVQRYNADVRSPCRPPDEHIDVTDVRWIAEYTIGIVTEMDCYEGSTGAAMATTGSVALELESKSIPAGSTASLGLFLRMRNGSPRLVDLQVGPRGALTFDPRVIQVRGIKGLGPYRVLASRIDNTKGEVQFVLVPLGKEGRHPADALAELEVEALSAEGMSSVLDLREPDVLRDSAGNDLAITVRRGLVTIEKAAKLKLSKVQALPNPVRNTNAVIFAAEGSGIAEIQVGIYDLSGREIFNSGWVRNGFEWHLLNSRSEVVANGVYLYVITIRGPDGTTLRSAVKKLAILR